MSRHPYRNSQLSMMNFLQQLYHAIKKLNQVEKAIVMLYMEDRTYEEMEEIPGLNQGSVREPLWQANESLHCFIQRKNNR